LLVAQRHALLQGNAEPHPCEARGAPRREHELGRGTPQDSKTRGAAVQIGGGRRPSRGPRHTGACFASHARTACGARRRLPRPPTSKCSRVAGKGGGQEGGGVDRPVAVGAPRTLLSMAGCHAQDQLALQQGAVLAPGPAAAPMRVMAGRACSPGTERGSRAVGVSRQIKPSPTTRGRPAALQTTPPADEARVEDAAPGAAGGH
jgi:hypothetical protein